MKTIELINPKKKLGQKLIINKKLKPKKEIITVILIVNEVNDFLKESLFSILNQSFIYFKIVLDIRNSDKNLILNFLSLYKIIDQRIEIKYSDNKINYFKRMKIQIKNAKNDYVLLFDQNAILDRTFLNTTYFAFKNFKNISGIYTNSVIFDNKDHILQKNYLSTVLLINKENINLNNISADRFFYKNLNNELLKFKKIMKLDFYGIWYHKFDFEKISLNKNSQFSFPISSLYSYNTEPLESKWVLCSTNEKDKWILCMAPWAKIGGADLFNLRLFEVLKHAGFKIILITTEYQNYELRQDVEDIIDEYYDLTTFLRRELWPEFIDYIIKDKNIKLIYQLSSLYGYYLIPWLKIVHPNVPIIDYLHAEDFSWRAGGFPKDSIAIAHYLDKTYTCTSHLKNLMINKLNHQTKNIEVAYIGTNTSIYNPEIIKIANIKLYEKLKTKKVILFPSRFSPEKRPLLFLKIIEKLNKINPDIVGLMIGGGQLDGEIKNWQKKLNLNDIIYILPLQRDIKQYYKMSDLIVICSLSEGLTLTTFEALSMGVPVISADVGAQKEAIIDDTFGKIIPKFQSIEKDLYNFNYSQDEIDEYCKAIISQLNNINKDTKINCRNYLIENFSQERTFEKMIFDIENFIEKGSNVVIESNNIEFAKRYLVLFNETTKLYYNNNNFDNNPTTIIQRLWKYPIWRFSIKTAKKLKIDKLAKKVLKRISKI